VIDPDVSDYSDAQLKAMVVSGALSNAKHIGAAKAELTKRQRQHELERDQARMAHENGLFNSEAANQVHRKNFDQRLAEENRAHADQIADQQLKVAARGVWITGFAAFAAIMSAIAAFASVWLSYHSLR
jgi:hypothetical protein